MIASSSSPPLAATAASSAAVAKQTVNVMRIEPFMGPPCRVGRRIDHGGSKVHRQTGADAERIARREVDVVGSLREGLRDGDRDDLTSLRRGNDGLAAIRR